MTWNFLIHIIEFGTSGAAGGQQKNPGDKDGKDRNGDREESSKEPHQIVNHNNINVNAKGGKGGKGGHATVHLPNSVSYSIGVRFIDFSNFFCFLLNF